MRQIVLITGRLYTGKSGLASLLRDDFGFAVLKTSDELRKIADERALGSGRIELQSLGDTLDEETSSLWVHKRVTNLLGEIPDHQPVVVDNIRTSKQLEPFRADHSLEVVHVHLYARAEDLIKRYSTNRHEKVEESELTYEQLDHVKHQEDVEGFKRDADVRINTSRTDDKDTLVRVAARLRLFSPPDIRCVDVIVG